MWSRDQHFHEEGFYEESKRIQSFFTLPSWYRNMLR